MLLFFLFWVPSSPLCFSTSQTVVTEIDVKFGAFWRILILSNSKTVSSNLPILSLGKELVGSNPPRNSVSSQLPYRGGTRFSSSDPRGKSISRSQINRIVLIQVGPAHWNYCQQPRVQGQTLRHMWETRFRSEGPQA